MRGMTPTRYALLGLVLFCYFLPLSGFSLYISSALGHPQGLSLVALGCCAAFLGSSLLFLLLQQWELAVRALRSADRLPNGFGEDDGIEKDSFLDASQAQAHSLALAEAQASMTEWQQKSLSQESSLNKREQEVYLLSREKERFQRQADSLLQEFSEYRCSTEEQLHQKEIFISELQQTLAEQRAGVEKKQQQLTLLENKVGELRYEIRTLLQLAEVQAPAMSREASSGYRPRDGVTIAYRSADSIGAAGQEHSCCQNGSHSHSHGGDEVSHQLRRCIEIAEKMTGVPHFSHGNKRLADLPINPFSLDLRRLCDALSSESGTAVLLYSPREKQLLFAHPLVKQVSGWSPDKFTQHFDEIIGPSSEEWHRALSHLSYRHETPTTLRLQGKGNEIVDCECVMALVPSGVFRNYAMAVLQPMEELLSSQQTTA